MLRPNVVLFNIFNRYAALNLNSQARNFSSATETKKSDGIKKSVFISQSKDVFSNLALEDWLYKNFDFTNHHVLMLWQNDPCVVIGRHQNPWEEVNIPNLTNQEITLARRNSGGGTVYHDNGNLNLTFFSPRERYNRKYNLELITRALFRKYGLTTNISPREDLTVRDSYKQISGTASKLGRPNAYHHCTLLVNVNKLELSQALQKRQTGITTNATKSIPSPVMNLCEEQPGVSVDSLIESIGWEYLRTNSTLIKDEGKELIGEQRGFQMINPTDQWFPGLSEIRNQFKSWDWCYGKTPEFTISRCFQVPSTLFNGGSYYSSTDNHELKITVQVTHGRVADVTLYIPAGLSTSEVQGDIKVITSMKGCKFTEEAMNRLESSLAIDHLLAADKYTADTDKFVTECVRKVMMTSV